MAVPLSFSGRSTGQTGATHLASSTPTWTAPTGGSSQTHIYSGPMASPLTTPGAACTGWTPSTMSSRGPTWTDATARPSSATVNSRLLAVFSGCSLVSRTSSQIAPKHFKQRPIKVKRKLQKSLHLQKLNCRFHRRSKRKGSEICIKFFWLLTDNSALGWDM